jgi:hypothetical protein
MDGNRNVDERSLRGRFGDAICEIHVSTMRAIPYLLDERRNVLMWFPDRHADRVEFRPQDKATALSLAIMYLETHVGPQNGRLTPVTESPVIQSPRIPPATIRL